ncbi:MAG: bifunctional phosphoribosylaminoimidazolecarboxamide formyltransferase/IMP cyclohydrolase, partial [Candidatus Muiribacteriaceae bacterium]
MINKMEGDVMKTALISVWDKTGLDSLAHYLKEAGYKFVATGSTSEYLKEQGFEVRKVSDLTGFPEILEG